MPAGQKVLIIGASGGVGTFAVQLAKWLGAEVTGVCSTRNLDLVRSLGADQVVDYTRRTSPATGGATTSSPAGRDPLAVGPPARPHPRGTLSLSSGDSDGRWIGPIDRMVKAILLSPFVPQRLGSFLAKPSRDDLALLRELIEAGTVRPVIDRTYPLREVPEAIRYLETGRARGKVVITV